MDNRRDLPGYKYYTDPAGDRPPVHVAFPDLQPGDGEVLGVLIAVTAAQLPGLDRRERNYRRVEVSAQLDGAAPGPVWAYVGTEAARARYAAGLDARRRGAPIGAAVIHAAYLRAVVDGFAGFGAAAADTVKRDLDPGEVAVCELVRHELPVYAGASAGSVLGAPSPDR